MYFKINKNNFLKIKEDFICAFVSVTLLAMSYAVHELQKRMGPRLFIGRFFKRADSHDYFIGSPSNIEEEICPICHLDFKTEVKIEWVPELIDINSQYKDLLNNPKHQIMKTPCNHLFHVNCLLTGMNFRMICPVCRSELPSLD